MLKPFIVSQSPHMHSGASIQRIMLDVIIALSPATMFSAYFFGVRALTIILLSIASTVASEYVFQKLAKKKITLHDLSAVVTGLLLGLNLPHTVPFFIPILGGIVAIVIIKQVFGGIGQNFMNPALGARAFLVLSFAGFMTRFEVDAVVSATPLGIIKDSELGVTALIQNGALPELIEAFIGTVGGSLGETSALMLLLGGLYLMYRKVISYRIPLAYIATTALLVFFMDGFSVMGTAYHLVSGGLFIGAFFMATDYASSPNNRYGQWIMGIGCGVLTVLIRLYGGYPEGVSFAILIMNLFVPLIDRFTIPRALGEVKS